jgi:hypothetical protein
MSVNASALSTVNPIVVYSVLGFYGILMSAALLYVYQKFSSANRFLCALKNDWETAQASHSDLLSEAKDKVSKLAPQPVAATTPSPRPRVVSFDTRNQVMSMGRKGLGASDIAQAFAMSEAEVDVLLGLARIQQ